MSITSSAKSICLTTGQARRRCLGDKTAASSVGCVNALESATLLDAVVKPGLSVSSATLRAAAISLKPRSLKHPQCLELLRSRCALNYITHVLLISQLGRMLSSLHGKTWQARGSQQMASRFAREAVLPLTVALCSFMRLMQILREAVPT